MTARRDGEPPDRGPPLRPGLDRRRAGGRRSSCSTPLEELPDGVPVVLATGGFAASRALLREHVTPEADELLLRAPSHATGDGLRLGLGGRRADERRARRDLRPRDAGRAARARALDHRRAALRTPRDGHRRGRRALRGAHVVGDRRRPVAGAPAGRARLARGGARAARRGDAVRDRGRAGRARRGGGRRGPPRGHRDGLRARRGGRHHHARRARGGRGRPRGRRRLGGRRRRRRDRDGRLRERAGRRARDGADRRGGGAGRMGAPPTRPARREAG